MRSIDLRSAKITKENTAYLGMELGTGVKIKESGRLAMVKLCNELENVKSEILKRPDCNQVLEKVSGSF